MVGVAATVELDSADARRILSRLSPTQLGQFADALGGLVTSQTQRRIDEEKTAPDGTPWAEWSPGYAAKLQRRNRVMARSLLVGVGDLRDSIQQYVNGDEVTVGTNLVYGAIHQFGGDTSMGHPPIPARPYLGLSAENATEAEQLVVDMAERLLK